MASGKKQFVTKKIGGITVSAGQIKDLGVVDLTEGDKITGTVTDSDGVPLPNILVRAQASGSSRKNEEDALDVFTDKNGNYTIIGIDKDDQRFYDIIAAALRPDSHDQRFSSGAQGSRYGEVRRSQVDTQEVSTVDFKLQLAQGSISGIVVTPDAGALEQPFEEEGAPGAIVLANKHGNIPLSNPLGDIEDVTAADGSFSLKGLVPGVYDLFILAKGYGSAIKRDITVTDTDTNISTMSLVSGFKLSGTLTKADGSAPSRNEYDGLVAIEAGFDGVLVGNVTTRHRMIYRLFNSWI